MGFEVGAKPETVDKSAFDNDSGTKINSHKLHSDLNTTPDAWMLRPQKQPNPRLRLFCFPYVGGGSTVYFHWPKFLPQDVEVCAIRLPGRESRLKEQPFTRLSTLVAVLAQVLMPLFDRPFAFFGHSMGSKICYELACQLRRESKPEPDHLFVSGGRAPHYPIPSVLPYYKLSDEEFLIKLRKLNGIPKEIFQDPELIKLFLPVLRADSELYMTYVYQESEPLSCPITAIGGVDDPIAKQEEMADWRGYTRGSFRLHILPGDHFFINTSRTQLLDIISRDIEKII